MTTVGRPVAEVDALFARVRPVGKVIDLASTNPLSLSELLMSSDKEFLAAHARPAATRHYAYAWGLAYYLSIETQVINRGTLAELSSSHHSSPLERFQSVVGKPLDEFEREWRRAMLALPLR